MQIVESTNDRSDQKNGSARLVTSLLSAVFALGAVFGSHMAAAKEMSNRLGIGYKNQFAVDLPGVAATYYPGPDLALAAILGVDTQKDNSRFGLMGKLYRIVFHEENLHFYMGVGAGMVSAQSGSGMGSTTDSGFELQGFGGAEFFLPGLENLGFSFEAGADVASMSSAVRFRTMGDSPLRAGITFYF